MKVRQLKTAALCTMGKTIGVPALPYYCPVCENKLPYWQPFRRDIGNGKSRLEPGGRLCPLCFTFERTRHIVLYLKHFKILEAKPRFLHFAPENILEGRLRAALGSQYVTTDLFKKGVDRKEDITKMTIQTNSFDFIYCSNVLEHIPDDRAAMSELHRVLAPGGTAIIQVPIKEGQKTYEDFSITDPEARFQHFGQADHVRWYGPDIQERLEAAGFEVTPFYMADVLGLPPAELERMNIARKELCHKCVKKK
ncbi:MAG: methyltransferase domain-containing protein [Verrucomicrobiales bacterium]|nr:methyltransferase domain-containing protein [Verrucomicrobiales bacterium]